MPAHKTPVAPPNDRWASQPGGQGPSIEDFKFNGRSALFAKNGKFTVAWAEWVPKRAGWIVTVILYGFFKVKSKREARKVLTQILEEGPEAFSKRYWS